MPSLAQYFQIYNKHLSMKSNLFTTTISSVVVPCRACSNNSKTTKPENRIDDETPPEPATCCMSGCANCVWLDYAEKLVERYKDGGERAIKEINKNITDESVKAYLLHEIRMRNKK